MNSFEAQNPITAASDRWIKQKRCWEENGKVMKCIANNITGQKT
jgi:hypothetical protein